jgi:hypothetical protein
MQKRLAELGALQSISVRGVSIGGRDVNEAI